ncbi:MAG TPA: site-2 protease family protein [Pyrinomonadaceae bacterium]|nr:site-2 protease family protein [Pyrinomonadaceae bacterium]
MLVSYGLYFLIAIFIHELGHLAAARACAVPVTEFGLGWGRRILSFRCGTVECRLHALPVGAYVRLDMTELQRRPLSQQVLVMLAGINVNLVASSLTAGTRFSAVNLLLAATNLLPLYQQDGWKCGMLMLRALLCRRSALVEWTFTIAGSCISVVLFAAWTLRHL